jgi:hypothetical protein
MARAACAEVEDAFAEREGVADTDPEGDGGVEAFERGLRRD